MPIYKILREPEWEALREAGRTSGTPDDLSDGFIHFSAAHQVADTLEKRFTGESNLWLVQVEEPALGDFLRWEPARGGDLFPHLYRDLELNEIEACEQIISGRPLPFGVG